MIDDLFVNKRQKFDNKLPLKLNFSAINFHKKIKGYKPTPLHSLRSLAKSKNVSSIFIKDESKRFGQNNFKALGPFYAIFQHVARRWNKSYSVPLSVNLLQWDFIFEQIGPITFTAASEGNHGKSLAWACKKIKQNCIIYLPAHVSKDRIEAIKDLGATVKIVHGSYDQTVRRCFKESQEHGRTIISDMSYQDYRQIPAWIMESYLTIFIEIQEQLERRRKPAPDFIFVQAGVGGLAAAAACFYGKKEYKNSKLICVEPRESSCILESAQRGKIAKTRASMETIMGCLNCDYPSYLALPTILKQYFAFLTVSDNDAMNAMRLLFQPSDKDPKIISGQSGSASFAGFCRAVDDPHIKKTLGINPNSVILCINTEGDSDRNSFDEIINMK